MKAEAEVREQRSEIRGQRSAVSAAKTIHYSLFTLRYSDLLIASSFFPSSFLVPPYSFSLLLLEASLFAIARHDPDAPAIEPLNERRSRD